MLMKAVYFGKTMQVIDTPRPTPAPDEALIRVHCAGICNTDLEIIKGYMAFRGILGHEFVGTVESCSHPAWLGKRVVGEINIACERCSMCASGLQRHCPERSVLGILRKDGAMAEYVTLPIRNLHPVPEAIPDEVAVFTEPVAAACEIAEQVHLKPGTETLVLGDGKLGLLIVQVLLHYGCRVTLLGRHVRNLQIAAACGAATCLDAGKLPDGFPLVVEATGSPAAFSVAAGKTAPRGTLVLKSTYANSIDESLALLVINEIKLIGSRCGPFPLALTLLETGSVDTAPLLSEMLPLGQALAAFQKAQSAGVLKVLLQNT